MGSGRRSDLRDEEDGWGLPFPPSYAGKLAGFAKKRRGFVGSEKSKQNEHEIRGKEE